MMILGRTYIDNQRRMNISGLLGTCNVSQVALAIDLDRESVAVFPCTDTLTFGKVVSLDDKKRIIIPRWIMEEMHLDERANFTLLYDPDKDIRYFSERTGEELLM